MEIAQELYDLIEEFSERGQDIDKLREEISEYVMENCRISKEADKIPMTDEQKEMGAPLEPTRMAHALFLGYHAIVDELSKEIDEFFEIIKNEDPDSELYKTLVKFKGNIERARKYFVHLKAKNH